jgi:Fe-S-cluster containining protein
VLRTRAALIIGSEHLAFKCNGCGDCCRRFRVALTHRDLSRLVRALGVAPAELVAWLTTDEVDFAAESASFVSLPNGPHLMVLAHAGGACRLLRADGTCSAYSARPLDCRLYPFVLQRDAARRPTRLALFEPEGCGERGTDGPSLLDLDRDDAERSAVLEEYAALVTRWNRLARHRARLRHPARGAPDFFGFLGIA